MPSESKGAILLTLLVALGVFSVTLYVPSMPAITRDFAVPAGEVQLTLGLFLLGFAIAQLGIGPLSDRFGRRPVLLAGLALYIAVSLLCALAASVEGLQWGRFLQGMAACSGPVVARAIVRDRFHGLEAVRTFAFIGTALALAPAVAPILGGFVEEAAGWRTNFAVLAAFGALLFVLASRRLPESHTPTADHALHPGRLIQNYLAILGNRVFLGNVLAGSLIFGGMFTYNTLAPYLFIEQLGARPHQYGYLMLFTVSAYATGSFLSGRLRRRVTPRRLVLLGTGSATTGGLILLLLSDELGFVRVVAPMMAFLFGLGLILPPTIAEAMHPFPRRAGAASALMGFLQMLFGALATFVAQAVFSGSARELGWITFLLGGGALMIYTALAGRDPAER
ncbi:MAG: multidrug effflux MFS transporter [Gammaproteobacteria bacterium]